MNPNSDEEATKRIQKRIQDPPTVENLMEYFFTSEVVESRCEAAGCDCKTATLTRFLLRPPRVLVIHLKRFRVDYQHQRLEKICERIDITDKLDISPFVSPTERFAKHIPFDAEEYQAHYEKNRQARLDKMLKKAAASKPSALATKGPTPTTKPGAKVVNSSEIEPPAKRQKISDEQPTPSHGSVFDFQAVENDASQDADLLQLDSGFVPPRATHYSSGHTIMEDDEKENNKSSKPTESAIDLSGADEDELLKQALAVSKAEAEEAERRKQAYDNEEEAFQRAIAESEKSHNGFQEWENFPPEDESTQEDEETSTGHVQAPGTKKDGEPSETSVDLKVDPPGSPKEDLMEDDTSTAPPSPRRLQDIDELEKQHIFPGQTVIYPECPPDPFWTDELRSSDALKPRSKANISHKYRLMALVHHIGSSPNHGHYVTDVYSPHDDSWTHHDDSRVVEVSDPGEFLKMPKNRETAYLLFYVHEDCVDKVAKKPAKKTSSATAK